MLKHSSGGTNHALQRRGVILGSAEFLIGRHSRLLLRAWPPKCGRTRAALVARNGSWPSYRWPNNSYSVMLLFENGVVTKYQRYEGKNS